MQPSTPRPNSTHKNSQAQRVPLTTWALLGIMLMAAVVLAYTRSLPKAKGDMGTANAAKGDFLHGDMDTATAGLEAELQKTPAAQRIPLLLKYVQYPNSGLRYAAVDALGGGNGAQVTDAVAGAFTDSASVVRQRAMEVLPKLDPERGLHLLLAGLRDDDLWIRQAAAQQLGLYDKLHLKRMDRAIPTLVLALDDSDSAVSTSAMNILRHLTGNPWRVTVKTAPAQRLATIRKWKSWWAVERKHRKIPAEYEDVAPIYPDRADPAPDYAVQDLDGHTVSLASQRGKITLLNFWGTWCPPCQQEIPDLVKLDAARRGSSLEIVGIALGEKGEPSLRAWCQVHGVAYRQALSTDAIQGAFGHIEEVPVSVLIDAQGRIRYRWEGERDYATFNAAVERLLKR